MVECKVLVVKILLSSLCGVIFNPGAAAALCIQRQGAIPSMPTREEVEKERKGEQSPKRESSPLRELDRGRIGDAFPSGGSSDRSMGFNPPKQTFW